MNQVNSLLLRTQVLFIFLLSFPQCQILSFSWGKGEYDSFGSHISLQSLIAQGGLTGQLLQQLLITGKG